MKKLRYFIYTLLAVAVIMTIVYKMMDCEPSAHLSDDEKMEAIISSSGCMDCHSANPELPFYASFPLAGDLVQEDIAKGYKFFDMTAMLNALKNGEHISEADLAKVEKVLMKGSMPPSKYYLVHWGSVINDTEKEMALTWIKNYRAKHYPNPLAAPQFANETVRPIPDSVEVHHAKAHLGEILFHDVRMSSDNTISCASCHALNTGGVDNKQYSVGVYDQTGGVNAPTVYNAYFNFVQFWDGRAVTLADQAAGPPLNPIEMGNNSFDEICKKLSADVQFNKAFTAVYPDGINEKNITNAIEEYEKTLLTPNSRFDKFLKGDSTALTENEIKGYELFKEYSCATCHVGENLGGKSYELMGVHMNYFEKRDMELTDEDRGRHKQTSAERDMHRFKVPGLRNIALTAPYFPDGTQKTIEDAVQAMGEHESGVTLTADENAQITAFLRSLTGEYKGQLLENKASE